MKTILFRNWVGSKLCSQICEYYAEYTCAWSPQYYHLATWILAHIERSKFNKSLLCFPIYRLFTSPIETESSLVRALPVQILRGCAEVCETSAHAQNSAKLLWTGPPGYRPCADPEQKLLQPLRLSLQGRLRCKAQCSSLEFAGTERVHWRATV